MNTIMAQAGGFGDLMKWAAYHEIIRANVYSERILPAAVLVLGPVLLTPNLLH